MQMGKMNIYLKTPPFALVFGLFAAKWSAFWGKTECVLVQNGVQNAAKCETKSIKIRCNSINKTFPNH